jgi:hypothetical protein
MSSPLLYALAFGPLGFYLWVLAVWQSGTRPRLVSGLVDFTLLVLALGGLLAFGPFGELLAKLLFGKPDWLDRMVIVSAMGLGATILARKALHRLVIYHVDPSAIRQLLDDVLNSSCGSFVPTLHGFEDQAQGLGVKVDISRWWRCAVVEAYGTNPEGLIQQLRLGLRPRLQAEQGRRSRIAFGLYGASIFVMLVPLVGTFLTQAHTREALRVLIQRLRGG